jgi:Rrf2 family transcriptional regulator, iron-sulfur cluster assembly transcription factor
MKLSTNSRYGVRAVFDIAFHSEGIEAQVKDISRRQEISPRYLEQIFQKLRKGGILGSKRGPSGGYVLKKRPDEITVGQIIRLTEGQLDPVRCVDSRDSRKPCNRSGECVTQVVWNEAGRRMKDYFDSLTINDLCKMAQEMGMKRESDYKLMYYI